MRKQAMRPVNPDIGGPPRTSFNTTYTSEQHDSDPEILVHRLACMRSAPEVRFSSSVSYSILTIRLLSTHSCRELLRYYAILSLNLPN